MRLALWAAALGVEVMGPPSGYGAAALAAWGRRFDRQPVRHADVALAR